MCELSFYNLELVVGDHHRFAQATEQLGDEFDRVVVALL